MPTFIPTASKDALIFLQELLRERTAICRIICSSRDDVTLGGPDQALAVNIPSEAKHKQDIHTPILYILPY